LIYIHPIWVVWGVRLTLLYFVTQTRSGYWKESCKDIGTVGNMNMVAGSYLLHY